MEQTALRPKPMPGQEPGGGTVPDPARRPPTVRRRRRRLPTLLFGLVVATALLLAGVGIGTVSATVIGMSKLAEMQRQAGAPVPGPREPGTSAGRLGAPQCPGAGGHAPSGSGRPDSRG
ncbi:hypothetical protein ACWD00_14210 [Streptomyces viridiviolaceus]